MYPILEFDPEQRAFVEPVEVAGPQDVSDHYLPPGCEIASQPGVVSQIVKVLDAGGIPYLRAKTWTTDAPYRVTRAKIKSRLEAGCQSVEMEAAGLMAVAQFRQVAFRQILYAGDDLSGDRWDHSGWQSRAKVRDQLFWMAAEACLQLSAA